MNTNIYIIFCYYRNIVKTDDKPLSEEGSMTSIKTESLEVVQIKKERIFNHNCSICNKGFNNWENLIIHKHLKHKNNILYKCEICDDAFVLKAHLNLHLLEHVDYRRTKKPSEIQTASRPFLKIITKRKPFKCTNCVYGTKSLDKFSYHQTVCKAASETNIDNDPNGCRLCFKKFLTESKLKRHMRYHKFMAKLNLQVTNRKQNINTTPLNNSNQSCNQQTFKSFRIKFATTKNIQQNSLREIKCSYCKISCKSDKAMVKHLKTFHPGIRRSGNHVVKMPTVKCQWCNTMITKRNLPRHIKAKHPQVKPLKCPCCPMRFKHFSSKKSHIMNFHNTNKGKI